MRRPRLEVLIKLWQPTLQNLALVMSSSHQQILWYVTMSDLILSQRQILSKILSTTVISSA